MEARRSRIMARSVAIYTTRGGLNARMSSRRAFTLLRASGPIFGMRRRLPLRLALNLFIVNAKYLTSCIQLRCSCLTKS